MMDVTADDVLASHEHALAATGYLQVAGWLASWHDGHPDADEQGYEGDHRDGPFSDAAYLHAFDAVADLVQSLEDPGDVTSYLEAIEDYGEHAAAERLGHDLWLTRNGHGTGFWDRGLGELGERLAGAARSLGEAVSYVDTDETVQVEG